MNGRTRFRKRSDTTSPASTTKRQMSMQSRRKQRSADQLLSRTGHSIPLTTPSSRPTPARPPIPITQPPQQPPQPTESAYQYQSPRQPTKSHSQSPQAQSNEWGFGNGSEWGLGPEPQHNTLSQQRFRVQPLTKSPPKSSNDQSTAKSAGNAHQHDEYRSPKNSHRLQYVPQPPHLPSSRAQARSSTQSAEMYDDLFAGDLGPDASSQTMSSVLGLDSTHNPFLQSNFKPSSFRSKLQSRVSSNQSIIPDHSGISISQDDAPQMVKVEKAASLQSQIDQNGQHPEQLDDFDFNPITQLREQFNHETGSNLKDPMDVSQLEHLQGQSRKAPQTQKESRRQVAAPLSKRTLIHPGEEEYDDESGETDGSQDNDDGEGYSLDQDPHHHHPSSSRHTKNTQKAVQADSYTSLNTISLKTARQKNPDQFGDQLDDDESDPEGYLQMLREREEEDGHFAKELDRYYRKFPEHRKLVHSAQNIHKFGKGNKTLAEEMKMLGMPGADEAQGFDGRDMFSGQMDAEMESDMFRDYDGDDDGDDDNDNDGGAKKGKDGKRRKNQRRGQDDLEMPSDMDDFSAFGASLRGDFGDIDFAPDEEIDPEIVKTHRDLIKSRTERLERNLKRKLDPNQSLNSEDFSDIDESMGDVSFEEENDEHDQNDQSPSPKKRKRQLSPLGEDNSFEIDGVRIPLRGLKKEDMESFIRENEQYEIEEAGEEQEAKEHLQSIGFTPEELDADRPKRIDYYKLPTTDQIPLVDTKLLDFDDIKSILNWDVPWPEHTSTCDLSIRTCILGTPNAGKSVIVNNLTRTRVTAVSAKRNTTRRRVLGIATEGNAQLTLYDTPGINEIHDAKKFQRDLATEAWDAVADADLALVVLDAAKRIGGPELFLLHKCSDVKTTNPNVRWVLALNKVDLVEPKDRLLDMLYRIQTLMPFDDCFMISGLDGDGMADLEHYLYQQAVPREWEHEREEKTDQTDVQLATELIRETLYHRLNKEIPYTVQQENVEWMPLKNGQLRIDQRLVVRRDQHKRILVGSNGAALHSITKAAEERLRTAFRRPVSLNLRVSVSVTQDFDAV